MRTDDDDEDDEAEGDGDGDGDDDGDCAITMTNVPTPSCAVDAGAGEELAWACGLSTTGDDGAGDEPPPPQAARASITARDTNAAFVTGADSRVRAPCLGIGSITACRTVRRSRATGRW